jgi:small subunit ribosomal protein S18
MIVSFDTKNMQKNNANSKPNLQEQHIDYKNVDLLKKFMNPHARIISKKRSGITAKQQRMITISIKQARFLGLMPYVAR